MKSMAKKRTTPGRPAKSAPRAAKAGPPRTVSTTGRDARAAARDVVRKQVARERARRRALIVTAIAAALLVVAGLVGWFVYEAQRPEPSAAVPAGADQTGVRVGTGPVTIDVYLDFMCPICKRFEDGAKDTLAKLVADNKATIVYHPISILDEQSSTRYSTRSSNASGCAADAGKFVDYANTLYENQPPEGGAGLADDKLIDLAGQAGIDAGPFGECVRAKKYESWVDRLTERAIQRGVTGTPTVYVNGKQVQADAQAITAAVG
jgi:protein-disulfide isomerase